MTLKISHLQQGNHILSNCWKSREDFRRGCLREVMLGASFHHRVEVFFLHLKSQEKHHLECLLFSPLLRHPGHWCLTPAHKTSKARRPEIPFLCEAKEVAAALGLDCTPGVCDGKRDKGVFYGPCRHWWERELAWIQCEFPQGGCNGNPIGRICVEWAWGGMASGKLMQSLSHGDASSCCQWGLWRAMRAPTRGKTALDTLQIQSPWSHFTTVPVKRRLSCSSHLSSLPITPHAEGSEGLSWAEGGEWERKRMLTASPSLTLWQEPTKVEAGGRRVIFLDRDNVICYYFLFTLSFRGPLLSPLKLGGTVWLVEGKDIWTEVMCVISRWRHREGPVWFSRPLRDKKPQDQSGLDHRVTTWRAAV